MKWHVFLALTFLAYFPFTKLVHLWTYPINFFVRPRQSMRTERFRFHRRWEFALRSDKSWLVYGLAVAVFVFVAAGRMLGQASAVPAGEAQGAVMRVTARAGGGKLAGWPLYVSQCARCHGIDGEGRGLGSASPTFGAPPRDLTRGPYQFVSTSNSVASDEDLFLRIGQGLPTSGVPAFSRSLAKSRWRRA